VAAAAVVKMSAGSSRG